MSHSPTLNHDLSEPHVKSIAWAMVLTTLGLLLIIWGTVYYYQGTLAEEINIKENVSGLPASLQEIRTYEEGLLTVQKVIDPTKNILQIPITQAMGKVVERYQSIQR